MPVNQKQFKLLIDQIYRQLTSNLNKREPELTEFVINSAMLLIIKSITKEDRAKLYQLLANDNLPEAKELINKGMPNFSDQLKKQVYIMLEQRND